MQVYEYFSGRPGVQRMGVYSSLNRMIATRTLFSISTNTCFIFFFLSRNYKGFIWKTLMRIRSYFPRRETRAVTNLITRPGEGEHRVRVYIGACLLLRTNGRVGEGGGWRKGRREGWREKKASNVYTASPRLFECKFAPFVFIRTPVRFAQPASSPR